MSILTIGIVISLIVSVIAGLYFYKRNKDIKDMINALDAIFVFTSSCKNYGKCMIDGMVDKFGYLRTKEIMSPGKTPVTQTADEQKFMKDSSMRCCKT
jgi:hypothetical protein